MFFLRNNRLNNAEQISVTSGTAGEEQQAEGGAGNTGIVEEEVSAFVEHTFDGAKNWERYSNPDVGVSFSHPPGWTVTSSEIGINISDNTPFAAGSEAPSVITVLFEGLGKGSPPWVTRDAREVTTNDGQSVSFKEQSVDPEFIAEILHDKPWHNNVRNATVFSEDADSNVAGPYPFELTYTGSQANIAKFTTFLESFSYQERNYFSEPFLKRGF